VLRTPEYFGAPGNSSVRYDSDLVLTKTTTDIIVIGHSYAPDGRPITPDGGRVRSTVAAPFRGASEFANPASQ